MLLPSSLYSALDGLMLGDGYINGGCQQYVPWLHKAVG